MDNSPITRIGKGRHIVLRLFDELLPTHGTHAVFGCQISAYRAILSL